MTINHVRSINKEIKSSIIVDANILKNGANAKILPDSEYPDWLWCLLYKRRPLNKLWRKNIETLFYFKRYVKLVVTDFHVYGGFHESNLESPIGRHEPSIRAYKGWANLSLKQWF